VQVLLHLDCLALQHLLLLELIYLGGHHPVSITPTRESSSALGAPPAGYWDVFRWSFPLRRPL